MHNDRNPEGKDIRFIDSHYRDLFRLPDGGCIQVTYPDETVMKRCTFIDEYHTQIGYNVFHICQFAELMERNGATYQAEPEIMGDEAAWKVGRDRILALQATDDGYHYTILNQHFVEVDGGLLENPELTMLQARTEILDAHNLGKRDLKAMIYDEVMEQMFEVASQAPVVDAPSRESLMEKLAQSVEKPSHPTTSHKTRTPER